MLVTDCGIADVKVIEGACFGDARGYFTEVYDKRKLQDFGVVGDFVQDSCSFSAVRATVRGLHFQKGASAQAKIVRVLRGSIFDVAVDLRRSSPTFGQHVVNTLTGDDPRAVFIPTGFAHGFCTLEADTLIFYKLSSYYAPDAERGVVWNDPVLDIDWPLDGREPVLSDRDRDYPGFLEAKAEFY